jgi:hypothetical protein
MRFIESLLGIDPEILEKPLHLKGKEQPESVSAVPIKFPLLDPKQSSQSTDRGYLFGRESMIGQTLTHVVQKNVQEVVLELSHVRDLMRSESGIQLTLGDASGREEFSYSPYCSRWIVRMSVAPKGFGLREVQVVHWTLFNSPSWFLLSSTPN